MLRLTISTKVLSRFILLQLYQVGLTVVDNDGARHSDALTVTVNSQPIARMQALPRVEPGKEILFDASGSADGGIAAYNWDFGDGGKAEGRQVQHVYAEPGRYQAVLTVQDESGAANDTAARLWRSTSRPRQNRARTFMSADSSCLLTARPAAILIKTSSPIIGISATKAAARV